MTIDPLISGLIGTFVGGVISWLNGRYMFTKQVKEQKRKEQLQEKRNEIIALNAVEKEIAFNLLQLNSIVKLMKSQKMDFINFKASQVNNNLKMDKWNKHSDTIDMMEDFGFLDELQSFYINLSHEINNQVTNQERTYGLISQGLTLHTEIGKYIKGKKEFVKTLM